MRAFAVILVLLFACACGGESPGSDAGPRDGGGVLDAGPRDGGGVLDAAPVDAGSSDASPADSGIDCSTIGCGPPSVCGACDAPCGCCSCGDGDEITIEGAPYVCSGGCYEPRGSGGSGDTCTETSECGSGLSCCYPCGIPGCEFVCEPTCDPESDGCVGGCSMRV